MATPTEIEAMRRAIALSALGLGTTSPNPPVGCVILDRDGRVVGDGFHERKGEPHAEAGALAAAGACAGGGTAIVTLEPCNHVGRTPACRQLLIDAGIVRVVVAVMDPTSRGEGGVAMLRRAGVQVETGVLADEAGLVLGPWLRAFELQRPIVTCAYRVQGDRVAAADADATRDLRRRADAVLCHGGVVEEGVAGSHGDDVFTLPQSPVTSRPADLLRALYAGGARSLVILDPAAGEPFLATGTVDRVIVEVPRANAGGTRPLPTRWITPVGMQLVDASGYQLGARLEFRPTAPPTPDPAVPPRV